ncbi:GNAT family N-acetyltransferase [Sphingomonas tabacisoli]|uniref:GNAT family N-acetyltransferase n=1 Tax=Sphingomonas tabacisoli TaxID=2249466 RepID=A0ABW4HZ08_9SPHN
MEDAIEAIRRFNRFYTRLAGALDARFLDTDLSLVEARVLYEIATREAPVAREIQAELGVDAGYLSRIVGKMQKRGWISRGRGGDDARLRPIALTSEGRAAFAALDDRQRARVEDSIAGLGGPDQSTLVAALDTTRALLSGGQADDYAIRPFRTGDMGMVTARQAILYAEGWGWNAPMEALLGEVTSGFLKNFKPDREQCWIAERAGVMAGSISLVDAGGDVAQLRLLYVEPWARGLGIGEALVRRCVDFASDAGYREIMLWTHSVLTSARRIYDAVGFRITEVSTHTEFGKPEQGEIWRMPLR